MTSRRSALRLLGFAPAAPLAAKAAVDKEIARMSGIAMDGVAASSQYAASGGALPQGLADYSKLRIAAVQYAKTVGLPEFVREQFRRQASYIGALDPDIAAKRSWSMSVKIATQRERNLARSIEQLEHTAWHEKSAMAFKLLTGWDWPW